MTIETTTVVTNQKLQQKVEEKATSHVISTISLDIQELLLEITWQTCKLDGWLIWRQNKVRNASCDGDANFSTYDISL